jgi:hypothetical protein
MLIISFFDPQKKFETSTVGLKGMPKQDELFRRCEEAIKKSKEGFTHLQIGLADKQVVTIPNAFHVLLTDKKDEKIGRILGPDGKPVDLN